MSWSKLFRITNSTTIKLYGSFIINLLLSSRCDILSSQGLAICSGLPHRMKTTSATAEECIIVQILSGFSLDWWLCFNGEFVVPVKLFHFVSYIRATTILKGYFHSSKE